MLVIRRRSSPTVVNQALITVTPTLDCHPAFTLVATIVRVIPPLLLCLLTWQ